MAPVGDPLAERSDLIASLGWILLFGFAAALTLHQILSADYWWHLRTGQLILETGSVPRTDTYTYTVSGSPWIDIHWLFQLGLYGLYLGGGHAGVVFGKLALIWGVIALLAPIGYRRQRSFVSIAVFGLLLAISCSRFFPRPELVSFVLLAATIRILDRFRRTGDASIYAIIPLQLLWVNVTGSSRWASQSAACTSPVNSHALSPTPAERRVGIVCAASGSR
jgi:hypothetical protein